MRPSNGKLASSMPVLLPTSLPAAQDLWIKGAERKMAAAKVEREASRRVRKFADDADEQQPQKENLKDNLNSDCPPSSSSDFSSSASFAKFRTRRETSLSTFAAAIFLSALFIHKSWVVTSPT